MAEKLYGLTLNQLKTLIRIIRKVDGLSGPNVVNNPDSITIGTPPTAAAKASEPDCAEVLSDIRNDSDALVKVFIDLCTGAEREEDLIAKSVCPTAATAGETMSYKGR